jgi:hypothetical protein
MSVKKIASKNRKSGVKRTNQTALSRGAIEVKISRTVKKNAVDAKAEARPSKVCWRSKSSSDKKVVLDKKRAAVTEKKLRFDLALIFIFTFSAILLVGYSIKIVWAAEFIEPPGGPAEGNIPVTIWNRDTTIIAGEPPGLWPAKQQDTSINIDGQLYFGDTVLDLGGTANGQHLLYGVARYLDGPAPYTYYMDSDDYLLRLDVSYTNYPVVGENNVYQRFSIDRTGNLYAAGAGQIGSWQSIGTTNYQMVQNDTSNYLLYGVARFDGSNPGEVYYADPDLDYLLWLRTYDYFGEPPAGYTDRFTVDVTGDVWAKGAIKNEGCFGAVFIGLTISGGPGGNGRYRPQDVSGYYEANNRCNADYAGAHVCSSTEMLESIKCSIASSPLRAVVNGTGAWVNSGPPGHTSNYDDCSGWTSAASTSYARYWLFDQLTGGRGTGVTCNVINGLQFACCR